MNANPERTSESAVIKLSEDALALQRMKRHEIGSILREARKNANLTTRRLSELCSVPYSQICRIEGGRVNVQIDTLTRICNALGVDFLIQ